MPSRRQILRAAGLWLATSGHNPLPAYADDAFADEGATSNAPAEKARGDEPSLVAGIRHLGKQFLENAVNVTGADGATSLPLPNGQALWVFGDTIEGPFQTVHGLDLAPLRSNTGLLAPRQSAREGVKQFRFLATPDGKRPRQLVPFAPHEEPARHRVWAMHGASVGERVYLFYHRISLLPDVDVFVNFRLDGMGIARASLDDLEFERLVAPDGTLEFWKGDAPGFGVFVQPLEGYLHLWGSLMTGMFLARVRPDAIENFSAFEYLVEAPTPANPQAVPRWSEKFAPSAPLFDGVPNEMSVSYNAYLQRYVAIYAWRPERTIVLRTAPRITGPWSAPQAIYRAEPVAANDSIYAAKEHPELAADDGRRIYITYVNSAVYAPQLIEATFR